MPIVCHRVNKIAALLQIPERFGVEIDVRFDTRSGRLYLHHDPQGPGAIEQCDFLDEYLEHFKFNPNRIIVFNIKDTGTEARCIELAKQHCIPKSHYFLLDVEFPFVYQAIRRGIREIASRFSEAEPLAQTLMLKDKQCGVDWVWIDTNSRLPLDKNAVEQLQGLRTCLVCPERWGRPHDIAPYIEQIRTLNMQLDAVMTNVKYADQWAKSGVVSTELVARDI